MKLADFAPNRQAAPKAQVKGDATTKNIAMSATREKESPAVREQESFKANLNERERAESKPVRGEERQDDKAVNVEKSKTVRGPNERLEEKAEKKLYKAAEKILKTLNVEPEKLDKILKDLEALTEKEDLSIGDVLAVLSPIMDELKAKFPKLNDLDLSWANEGNATGKESPVSNIILNISSGEKNLQIHINDNPEQMKLEVKLSESVKLSKTKTSNNPMREEDLNLSQSQSPVDEPKPVAGEQDKLAESIAPPLSDEESMPAESGTVAPNAALEFSDEGKKSVVKEVAPASVEKLVKSAVKEINPMTEQKIDSSVESEALKEVATTEKLLEPEAEAEAPKQNVKAEINIPSKGAEAKNVVAANTKVSPELLVKNKAPESLDIAKETLTKAMPKEDLSKLQSEVKSFEFTVKKPNLAAEPSKSPLKTLVEAAQNLQNKFSQQQEGQSLTDEGSSDDTEFRFEKELGHSFKKLKNILHKHQAHLPFSQNMTQAGKTMPKGLLTPASFKNLQSQILNKLNQTLPTLKPDQNVKMSLEVQNLDLGNVRITIEQSGNQLNINVQGDRALNQLLNQARNELQGQIKMDGFEGLDLNMNFGDDGKDQDGKNSQEDSSRVALAGEESEDIMRLFEESSQRFFNHLNMNAG